MQRSGKTKSTNREKLIKEYAKCSGKDKRVKNKGYAIILIDEDGSVAEKFARASRMRGYPVYANSCPFDREKTVGYFIGVKTGNETTISLCAGVGSCYGVTTDFIYDSESNATEVLTDLNGEIEKLNQYAKVVVTKNQNTLIVTVTAFCQDKFEWSVMEIARITSKFCPLVKVNDGYDSIEQDYGIVNALADLNYKTEKLTITDKFNGKFSLAKGKLYCEVTINEDALELLADTIITITTEAMK